MQNIFNMPGSRKRQRRATGNKDINQLCWDWFQEATGRRINISGPLIQAKFKVFLVTDVDMMHYIRNTIFPMQNIFDE
jgi:hypothetical protein